MTDKEKKEYKACYNQHPDNIPIDTENTINTGSVTSNQKPKKWEE